MGKRKSSKRVQKSGRPKLEKVFDCPFCNHNKTVEVEIRYREKKGSISCRVCGAAWGTVVNHLTEAIDLYSDWIDECERQNSGYANNR